MLIYKKRLVRDRYQLLILQTPFNAVLHLFKATYIEIWCFVKRIQGRKTCLFFIQKVCVCSHYQFTSHQQQQKYNLSRVILIYIFILVLQKCLLQISCIWLIYKRMRFSCTIFSHGLANIIN